MHVLPSEWYHNLPLISTISRGTSRQKKLQPTKKKVSGMYPGWYILRGNGVNSLFLFRVYLLVFGALLVAVAVSTAAGAGPAAVPPPPFPGA